MKIAVFFPNWIGDAVMATPALRALRQRFPDAHIATVQRPYVAAVLDGLSLMDEAISWSPGSQEPQQSGMGFIRRMRREQFDLAVLFPNSFRSAWAAWASGAKRRLGFARNGRSFLLTDTLKPKPRNEPHPVIDEYLRLAQYLGATELTRGMALTTTPADQAALEAALPAGFPPGGWVCLNPGGAFGASKHWPDAAFGELAKRIARDNGQYVLVLCGPAERESAAEIVRQAQHPAVFGLQDARLSIGLSKEAVRRSRLLVTTDSGPRHFAPPFAVPVVTIFGPTHIAWSETFYPQATHVQLKVDCGPCQRRVCPLMHHRCMRDLRVETVYEAVLNALGDEDELTNRITSAA